ncbi:hypothetical protein PVNG_06378 [Plasmodium vivax North Korean]|uniref:Variable surface protein n=1 Tax=Plasmodium vivax North Korean TaxID=1035514 RepID=A0A0J9U0Y5_PLAVI|nr:hypothetical protein PVNG_06378 [Plasmodium vivax North Korean]
MKMSKIVPKYFLNKIIKNKNILLNSEHYLLLKGLRFYEFYEELDKELRNSTDSEPKCVHCESNIASEPSTGKELIYLCKKVCNIIINVNGILDKCKNNTDDKPCQYMSYWLYNNVMSISNNLSLIRSLYHILRIFCNSRKPNFNNCILKNFNMDRNAFENKHILYEFLESYDDMKNKIDSHNELYTPLYCKHVKENFNFYNLIKDNCTNDTCEYSNDLRNFKKKFSNSDVLEFIYDKCDYIKTSCEQGSNEEGDVPCLREKGNSFLNLIFGNDTEDIIKVLLNVTIIFVPILAFFVILFKVIIFFLKK